jgi:hypothetical protein
VLEGCKAGRLSNVRVYVEGTEEFNVETSKLKNRASKLDAEQLSSTSSGNRIRFRELKQKQSDKINNTHIKMDYAISWAGHYE